MTSNIGCLRAWTAVHCRGARIPYDAAMTMLPVDSSNHYDIKPVRIVAFVVVDVEALESTDA